MPAVSLSANDLRSWEGIKEANFHHIARCSLAWGVKKCISFQIYLKLKKMIFII